MKTETMETNVLLANDTSDGPNPGCRAVMAALLSIPALRDCRRLPLGYWADRFRPIASRSHQIVARPKSAFPFGTDDAPPLDIERWREFAHQARADDMLLAEALRTASHFVVNGEGTIHHNLPRALALMALIDAATEAGVPAFLLNASVHGMSPSLIARVLPKLSFIHVRESRSKALLDDLGIRSWCAPDLALASIPSLIEDITPDQRACVVTAGVLAGAGDHLGDILCCVRERGLDPIYLRVGDGGEGPQIAATCADASVQMIHASDFSPNELLAFLAGARVAVSGRHHINMYLLSAGTPFVALPSNTWKIEATMEDMGLALPLAHDLHQLAAGLDYIVGERCELSRAARATFEAKSSEAKSAISRIVQCVS